MDQLIRDRYNDTILQEAMRRYGIRNDQIHALAAFESFIYEFERDSQLIFFALLTVFDVANLSFLVK
jgi:hypothetical protein